MKWLKRLIIAIALLVLAFLGLWTLAAFITSQAEQSADWGEDTDHPWTR